MAERSAVSLEVSSGDEKYEGSYCWQVVVGGIKLPACVLNNITRSRLRPGAVAECGEDGCHLK